MDQDLDDTDFPILPDLDERRTHPRYRLRLPVNIRFDERKRWSSAILVDLSAGGVLVRTRARSTPGNTIHIRFQSYDNGTYEMKGQVVRLPCIPQPGGFAVRFAPGSPGLAPLLAEIDKLPPEERATFLACELRPFIEVSES